VFVVGNGVDVAAFTPAPRRPQLRALRAGSSPVISFIGGFFAYEGLPMLDYRDGRAPRYPRRVSSGRRR
jgi:hypothetical protein